MQRNPMMNDPEYGVLDLTLPSGKVCHLTVRRATRCMALVDDLVEQKLVFRSRYEFVSEQGVRVGLHMPLEALFSPGKDRAEAELRFDRPDTRDRMSRIQELYGCPTAVTGQAEQLADCTVTKITL